MNNTQHVRHDGMWINKVIWGLTLVILTISLTLTIGADIVPVSIFEIIVAGVTSIIGFIIISFSIVQGLTSRKDSSIVADYRNAFKKTQIILFICVCICLSIYMLNDTLIGGDIFGYSIYFLIKFLIGFVWVVLIMTCLYYLFQCFEDIYFLNQHRLDTPVKSKTDSSIETKYDVDSSFEISSSFFGFKPTPLFILLVLILAFIIASGIMPSVIFEITLAAVVSLIGFILTAFSIAISILPKDHYLGNIEKNLLMVFRRAFSNTGYALLTSLLIIAIFHYFESLSYPTVISWETHEIISLFFSIRFFISVLWIGSLGIAIRNLNDCFDKLIEIKDVIENEGDRE